MFTRSRREPAPTRGISVRPTPGPVRRALAAIGIDDVVFVIGLALLSAGAGQAYAPAGLMVPGAILVWLTVAGAARGGK